MENETSTSPQLKSAHRAFKISVQSMNAKQLSVTLEPDDVNEMSDGFLASMLRAMMGELDDA